MTPDSSAAVAAFASWHDLHDAARRTLAEVRDLVAHVELEAYSVLTRLPPSHRAAPPLVAEYLRTRFPGDRLALDGRERRSLVTRLADAGISGGAVYDALIAATAAAHDLIVVSCDVRAAASYRRLGVGFELLAGPGAARR